MGYGPAQLTGVPSGITIVPGKSQLSPLADACRLEGVVYANGVYPAANRAIFLPFEIADAITARNIGWLNSTTVNGNIDVGIYDHFGRALVTLGGVAMSGSGVVQVGNIADTLLPPGYYYLAFASSSATATFQRAASSALVMQSVGVQQMAAAYPLPSVATFSNPASAYHPLVWLNASQIAA
jgi:hypothetical protein